MPAPTRRRALGLIAGALASAGLAGAGLRAALKRWRYDGQARAQLHATAARDLRDADPQDALALGARWLREGWPADLILESAFLAPMLHGCDARDLHARLVIPAILTLTERAQSPRPDHLEATLWACQNAAVWMHTCPSSHRIPAPTLTLAQAWNHDDPARAEAAAAQLKPTASDLDQLALRAVASTLDPHPAILLARALEMIARLPDHTPAILGNLGRALTHIRPDPDPRLDTCRQLASDRTTLPDTSTPQDTLLTVMRDAPLRDWLAQLNASPQRAWALLTSLAAEQLHGDPTPTGQGVHAMTLVHALHDLAARTTPPTGRALMLRGVQWVRTMRSTTQTYRLETLAPFPSPDAPLTQWIVPDNLETALAPNHAQSWLLDWLERNPRGAFASVFAHHAVTHASDAHGFKHPAALLAMAERLPAPWSRRVLATAGMAPVLRTRADAWPERAHARTLIQGR